jgi:hypothetical protein
MVMINPAWWETEDELKGEFVAAKVAHMIGFAGGEL